MIGEMFAGISGFKTMLDIAKSVKDMSDATSRQRVSIELQEQILAAQTAQFALTEQISALKTELTKFEKWETQTQAYELKNLGWGAFAYMLKPEARRTEPPHWVCANCYEDKKIRILQFNQTLGQGNQWRCPSCKNQITPTEIGLIAGAPKWID